jgi:hypothetical protein
MEGNRVFFILNSVTKVVFLDFKDNGIRILRVNFMYTISDEIMNEEPCWRKDLVSKEKKCLMTFFFLLLLGPYNCLCNELYYIHFVSFAVCSMWNYMAINDICLFNISDEKIKDIYGLYESKMGGNRLEY